MALAEEFVQLTPETAGFKEKAQAEIGDVKVKVELDLPAVELLKLYEKINREKTKAKVKVEPDIDRNIWDRVFASAGFAGGAKMASGISGALESAQSEFVPILVAAAAAASPAIGAAITTGVLLGVGGGTLAAGIISQAKDPAVSGAFKDLGTEIKNDLTGASAGFRDPLIQAAHTFSDVWNAEVRPGLAEDFNILAPSIDHLSAGVAGFAHNVMPGFNDSIRASAPLLNQLGNDTLPRMGSAIGQFFSTIAQGGPGAQAFFRDLTTGVDLSVKQLGSVTLALTKMYDESRKGSATGALLTGTFNLWATGLEKLDGGAKNAHTAFTIFNNDAARNATAAQQAAVAEQQLAAAIQRVTDLTNNALGNQLSLVQANENVSQSYQNLKDSVNQHGTSLKDNTSDGLANRAALLGSVSALVQQRDAAIAAAGGVNASREAVDAANAKYDQSVGALLDMAGKMGLSRGEAESLAASLRSIPNIERTVTIDYITNHINRFVSDQGGASAYQQSASVLFAQQYGGIIAAAQGMIAKSPTVLFGERSTGMEAFIPQKGISDSQGLAYADTAARWHGGRVVPDGNGNWASGPVELGPRTIRKLGEVIGEVVVAGIGMSGARVASHAYVLRRGG